MDKQNAGLGIADALQSEAYIAGRRAGLVSLSPSLNPYADASSEAIEWARGRQSGCEQVNATRPMGCGRTQHRLDKFSESIYSGRAN